MATIKPFRAIRPVKEKAAFVAALPYDVMNSKEARKEVEGNPYSFLHIDKAEIDLDESIDLYDDKVYEKAKENFEKMMQTKVFIQDSKEMCYIYRLIMNGKSQTGLVVCTSIDEYLDGTIKKHELTREDKEIDRIKHVTACNANTGPIFLAYKANEKISAVIENWTEQQQPIYDFVSKDNVKQTIWAIDEEKTIETLIDCFKQVQNFYIADGHHRNASAVKVGLEKRKQNSNYTGKEEFNFYLSVLFPSQQLEIMDYNRLVKDLNGYTKEEFLSKIREKFDITIYKENDYCHPKQIHEFGMYLEGNWYLLCAKPEIVHKDVVQCLDVSILQNELLAPILSIGDPRTDKRIDFVGGIRGLEELKKRVNSGEMKVAFSMFPTSMKELMTVADQNKIMPPKSTWFEPKLRSGLFIHSLD